MATRKRVVEAVPRKRRAPELESIKVLVMPDENPDPSYLDQDEFEERLAAYKRGDFSFVGVRAEAAVIIDGVVQTLTSGGLYGIESDSDKAYFEEVGAEEWDGLRQILKTVGVATDQLPQGFDPQWLEWRA